MNKKYYWFLPFFIMGFIFYLSSQSDVGKSLPKIENLDKVLHFIAYFTLCFFWLLAFFKNKKLDKLFYGVLFTTLYGLSDEIHQLYVPIRTFEWLDLLADFIGALSAFFLWKLFLKKQNSLR